MNKQFIKRASLVFGMILLATSLIGCSKTGYKLASKELTDSKTKLSGSDVGSNIDNYKTSIESAQDFAFELLKQSVSEHKTVVISPVSAMTALSLTAGGTSGDTLSQIQKALGTDDMNKFDDLCNYFINRSEADKDSTKAVVANSVWIKDGIAKDVKDEFIKKASEKYGAQIYSTAFDSTTSDDINKWAAKMTDKNIEHMVDDVDKDGNLYFANAAVFDGTWTMKYKEEYIAPKGEFTDVDGNVQTVKLMRSEETLGIYENDDPSTSDPFGLVKHFTSGYSFVALLPGESEDIWTFVNRLDGNTFRDYLKRAGSGKVTAFIPEFDISSETNLTASLQNVGIAGILDSANMDNMLQNGSSIKTDKIIQKVRITVSDKAVDEETTEYEEPHRCLPSTLYFNRPFVYAVIDNTTNIPVYLGVITSME